jgi:hypothetical protein
MSADADARMHEAWLGMVQPVEGLVVSVPVLVDAQCARPADAADLQRKLAAVCGDGAIASLERLFWELLDLTPDRFEAAPDFPDTLSLYVPEGRQTLRPTLALRRDPPGPSDKPEDRYTLLVWDLPAGLPLDKAEAVTGDWEYPPAAKFDRLLRHCRVPIGLLTNQREVRLIYAPHGESSGSITFRVADMLTVGGRPILEAMVMLLGRARLFGVAPEQQLPAILARSRLYQAGVTNELAGQVREALETLLRGFEDAAERDGRALLDEAVHRDDDHLYGGLLTVLLRLVFLLYAEDRGLMPVGDEIYARNFSALGLFAALQEDQAAYADSMSRRFGAWGRLLSLFRAVFLGAQHGSLQMPARRGEIFDPQLYPFLEGWGPSGAAPINDEQHRAAVRVPSVDDGTVFRVLERLLLFKGQRLAYRALDVEQIGSVYEGLMGYHVRRLPGAAVCLRPNRVWVVGAELLEQPAGRRARWLQDETGLSKGQAEKLAAAVNAAEPGGLEPVLAALETAAAPRTERAPGDRLVLQPGAERRRTSSHYTPRSLTEPIVRRTLEPLLAAMGPTPSSERLLDLKICDPAMGSGAFLVAACRALADEVVAAWTRERQMDRIASAHEDVVLQARRLVAQRCLYGVDKNAFAVSLAKLSLWLATLARDLPFTFLDHALRHGDSLVGLTFDQIVAFHWKPGPQLEITRDALKSALDEAIALRQQILDLAGDTSPQAQKDKERLLRDAEDALDHVRLLGDLVVGAFFSSDKEKERVAERNRRLDLVTAWLQDGGAPPDELRDLQQEIRQRIPVLHWMTEYPEVFWVERPDPIDQHRPNGKAWMDAFVGNPPFMGKNGIGESGGPSYLDWLLAIHAGAHGNADLSAHFFRRTNDLLGDNGTIGLIATNTIAQGDTRESALKRLVAEGLVIYDAMRSQPWPGDAAVAVSIVHLAKGTATKDVGGLRLDGAAVEAVSSRLRGKPERPDPTPLRANAGLSFQGSIVLGMGFVLTPAERDALVAKDPRNAERIFPYLGGEELNSSPTQTFERYVISFGQMPLEEAKRWPDLIAIVREKVKPEREAQKDKIGQRYWWQFLRTRPELYEAIHPLSRCLVMARDPKHFCFSFQPTDRIFSEKLYVFAVNTPSFWSILSSRPHISWALFLGRTTGGAGTPSYSTNDCFAPFPFPTPDPRAVVPALEEVGARLYEARARFMVETQQGLTDTYNRLKDPGCDDPRVLDLRRLHEELDRAVLDAYDWSNVPVPPFCPLTDGDRQALEAFQDEVIDRLFLLNARRAEEERLSGAQATSSPKRAKGAKRAAKSSPKAQLSLADPPEKPEKA